MSRFSKYIGTEQDVKTTTLNLTGSNELRQLLLDYMPYNPKDDVYKYAKEMLDTETYGSIFDKFEFKEENMKYLQDKYKRLESEKFNDFIVNSSVANKEHKCIVDEIDSKFPEVKNRFEKVLMSRIELHKKIAKTVIHGLKSQDDYILMYLVAGEKIKFNSVLLGCILTRENIEEWSHTITLQTLNELIPGFINWDGNIDTLANSLSLVRNEIKNLSTAALRLMINAPDEGIYNRVHVAAIEPPFNIFMINILNGGGYNSTYNDFIGENRVDEFLEENNFKRKIYEFKNGLNQIISGRGLFNPRNYNLTHTSVFNLNTIKHNRLRRGNEYTLYTNPNKPFKESTISPYFNREDKPRQIGIGVNIPITPIHNIYS